MEVQERGNCQDTSVAEENARNADGHKRQAGLLQRGEDVKAFTSLFLNYESSLAANSTPPADEGMCPIEDIVAQSGPNATLMPQRPSCSSLPTPDIRNEMPTRFSVSYSATRPPPHSSDTQHFSVAGELERLGLFISNHERQEFLALQRRQIVAQKRIVTAIADNERARMQLERILLERDKVLVKAIAEKERARIELELVTLKQDKMTPQAIVDNKLARVQLERRKFEHEEAMAKAIIENERARVELERVVLEQEKIMADALADNERARVELDLVKKMRTKLLDQNKAGKPNDTKWQVSNEDVAIINLTGYFRAMMT